MSPEIHHSALLRGAYQSKDAALYLGISQRSLGREVASDRIKPRRFGRILLFERVELDRWLTELPTAKPTDVDVPERHG